MNMMPDWNKDALLGATFFAPLHPFIARFQDNFPTLHDCNALLLSRQPAIRVQSEKLLYFVPQESGKLPFEAQYEPRCYLNGEVSTRAENWHDLFNALVWMAFPRAKSAINARHYHVLSNAFAGDKIPMRSQRGAVRDACTLLDESGVIVVCADIGLAELLRGFQWKQLFWAQRAQVQSSMGFYLFGHSLYEKALRPYVGLTGHGLLFVVEAEFFTLNMNQRLEHVDVMLSDYLSSHERCVSTCEFTPVPLLGVPGWTAENENAAFYDNTNYFRAGRHKRSTN
jgi:Protein of unknown function (DUF3025)